MSEDNDRLEARRLAQEETRRQAQEKLDHLAQTYYNGISKLVYKKVPEKDAPDVTQDCFQRAYEHFLNRQAKPVKNERAWLYAIARNCIADYYEAQKKTPEEPLNTDYYRSSLIGASNPEAEAIQQETLRETDYAINAMPPRHRNVMVRVRQGDSTQEIATETGLSKSAVRVYKAQGRETLRRAVIQ